MRIKQFSNLAGADFDRFLTAFCKIQEAVREGIYRTGLVPYPSWIGFICQPTPFAKDFWIVEDSLGRVIGRIGANLSVTRPKEGAIGFFEIDLKHPEASVGGKSLLAAAEAWLKERHAHLALGPMNFNAWYQYRFRLGSAANGAAAQAGPVFGWEPLQPPEYVAIWESAGYAPRASYESCGFSDLKAVAAETLPSFDSLVKSGHRFQPLNPLKDFDEDLRKVYDVSVRALQDQPLFEPITPEAFRGLHVALSARTDLSQLLLDSQGHGLGFVTAFEDHGHVVLRRLAVVPEARASGVAEGLVHAALMSGQGRGLSKVVTALATQARTPDEMRSSGLATLAAQPAWSRSFALYQKPLVD